MHDRRLVGCLARRKVRAARTFQGHPQAGPHDGRRARRRLPVAPALAVPECATVPPARAILDGQGVLESVAVQPDGALFHSDMTANAVMRLDRPGATPS